jgi:hypothetical protein
MMGIASLHPSYGIAFSKQRRHLPYFQGPEKHRAVDEAQREGARERTISTWPPAAWISLKHSRETKRWTSL